MNDYSDLVYLISAMVLFSLLTLNVSRTLVLNSKDLAENEVEYQGVTVAQSIIDEAKWKNKGDFIDLDGNSDKENIEGVDYNFELEVDPINVEGTDGDDYELTVSVGSNYFNSEEDYPIKLTYIRSF